MEDMEILLEENIRVEENRSRNMLIGKIIEGKVLYRRGVLSILRNIWPIEVAPLIREVGENVYSISFKNENLMRRALEESPWSIMG